MEAGADVRASLPSSIRRGGPRSDLGDVYARIVPEHGTGIARVVSALAREDALPALVLSAAGKDRTGIVIGLVLSALGVADEVVLENHAVSEALLDDRF